MVASSKRAEIGSLEWAYIAKKLDRGICQMAFHDNAAL